MASGSSAGGGGEKKVVRWGIMATGWIAQTFTKDLYVDPSTRQTTDIVHRVTGVASSSTIESAKKFVAEYVVPKQPESVLKCSAYGTYEELAKDPDVDIIYIGSPHSHHYQNAMLCLTNGKPVLCEKALTVNAAQAKKLYATAKEKNLFFMEAVWTRYFPLSIKVRKTIQDGDIGEVLRVVADLTPGMASESFDLSHRLVNMDLAGGVLLDLGIYSLTWVFQTLYHTLPKEKRQPPKVTSAMTLFPKTGADYMTSMTLEFPRSTPSGSTKSHGIALTSFDITHDSDGKQTAGPSIRIYGTKGEIQVFPPAFRPSKIRIIPRKDKNNDGGEPETIQYEFPGGGHGMFWEADEAARCWRDGKLESEGLDWEESTIIMEVMDQVRQQGGLRYPDEIETTDYPVNLKALSK